MRREFGCTKTLLDDCVEKLKKDLTKGNLTINIMSDTKENDGNENEYKISCDSFIVSARSDVFRSLIARKNDAKALTFAEDIFPRSYAHVFIHFLYTDCLDLSLVPSSEITISSLSEAKAIVSGKSPDIQLHQSLHILQIAKFFKVDRLVQCCEDVVVKFLSVENCIAVYQWAKEGGSKYIEKNAKRLIESEFSRLAESSHILDLTSSQFVEVLESQFIQATELQILSACIAWGEVELLRKLEECEPNIVADTCHSISRRGLRESDMSNGNLRNIVGPLTNHVRKDFILPPFHQTLTDAYNRHVLDRAPLPVDLIVCPSTSEINPDLHWLRIPNRATGPRYYKPYHEVLQRHSSLQLCPVEASCSFSTSPALSCSVEDEAQISIISRLVIANAYPDIIGQDDFENAKNRIISAIKEVEEQGMWKCLPRSFHKRLALNLIKKRVLAEMDINEELVICYFRFQNIEEDEENRKEVDSIDSIPSIPDILIEN
ncbi:unnamed protein product [Caenorhabditis bovis]|uniref:BACK domain-containing protein n=1 Tax=Caenorhabditis bovis TaxID=2654633 RepID=A0A8S1E7M0_9PELO|nr:unnamed protein product [Caenorhabditis bovis]